MLRKFSVSLVLSLLSLGMTSDAQAGWGSWGGSYGSYGSGGSYGSYASSYGSGGSTGSYGSYGSWGGYGSSGGSTGGSSGGWSGRHAHYGLFARLHANKLARRAARNYAYASSGGSWGGSSGGSNGSWGGSYGSHGSSGYGSSGGSTGSWSYSTAAVDDCVGCDGGVAQADCDGCSGDIIEGSSSEDGGTMQSVPMEGTPSEARHSTRKGVLTVSVPDDAKILVNGMPTRSTGDQRRYVSHGLKQGESYRYVVKAVVTRDGQEVEQTKVAMLQGGKITSMNFDFNGPSSVETSLTLDVPEDAKVYLSGTETRASGTERRFSTTRIEKGQKWADYLVRVTVERDGRTLSKEQRVTLTGGDQAELNFNFDQTELADAR